MNRQKIFFLRITFLFSVALTWFAFPVMANATTYYVATTGSNTSPYETWAKAATSIQTAVSAASNDDIIIVGSSDGHGTGSYTENLEVNKQVTIQSENGNSTTTVVAASSSDHVFEVTEDNVTINGFSIYGATGGGRAGICLTSVTNCTIENNRCGWDGTHKNWYGIYMNSSTNCTINNNTTSYNTGQGIYLTSSNNNNLTSNIANYNGVDGVFLTSSLSNNLDGNTVSNNTWDGIHIESSSNSTTINNNTANDNGTSGIVLDSSSDNDLTNNITNSNGDNLLAPGISLSSSSNNTLDNNTANYNKSGINLESGSSDNELTSNTVSHNEFGIYLTESSNNTITSNAMNDNDGRFDGDGIMLNIDCSYNTISNNTMNNDPGDGIEFYKSSNNTVMGNTLDNSGLIDPGASMRINYYSSYNTIINNTVINGAGGIVLEEASNYNFVSNNTVTGHSGRGFEFWENASYNTLTCNNISNNGTYGIWLPSGSYNTIYLNDISNNTTANIYSLSTTTTWHSPTTIYYDYSSGTFHKGYLGNYYSDGTHTGSNGIGGTYTIATDNDDEYQLINTSDNYSLQAWWLYSDDKMYRDDFTKAGGSVTISGSSSNIWIADQAALTTINCSGSDTWTGQLVFTSAPTNGHTFTVEIGSSTDGSDFTPGGSDATLTGDGSSTYFTFVTDASAFSVTTGNYLALRITSNNAEYSVRTGGAWSYCSSPDNSIDYTLPVTLSAFTAQYIESIPVLYWTTQSETDNLGWNVYRNTNNDFSSSQKITDAMIQGNGTTTEPSYYIYNDTSEDIVIGQTYWYWLESIDYSGLTISYGSISLIIPEEGEEPGSPEIPNIYGLHQNYPNPFNPNTEISFMMKESCIVELSIYNIKGQKTKTIFTNESIPGDELIISNWNGKDEFGKEVSSGVYYYKLRTTKENFVRKMILMK